MQVHDELVLEVPELELERVKAIVPGLMTNLAKLDVPLQAGSGLVTTGTKPTDAGCRTIVEACTSPSMRVASS